MSILINMELPHACMDCIMSNLECDWCILLQSKIPQESRFEKRMKQCPLVPVLPFYAPTSKPIVTNYDRIISKTPEELARWIWAVQSEIKHEDLFSTDGWYIWLMQEAKEPSE